MQRTQVFKIKGMQRDTSMPNSNGEFAYEVVNMRVLPAEEGSGFSLTNERGTFCEISEGSFRGDIIGQCATTDSIIVFTTDEQEGDKIWKVFKGVSDEWDCVPLYEGNLNFSINHPIEAIFNYETEDIQKIYWIDGINQLRCINIAVDPTIIMNGGDSQFDSVKEISLPKVKLTRTSGGTFTAGIIQYYVTYFNEFMSESPIVYISPLLYIAHLNRGAKTNDTVNTAFQFNFTQLDTTKWKNIRIYATHRTSLNATPEAYIVSEMPTSEGTLVFTDLGQTKTSIGPSDLYFIGSKFVKAGTMTVKDQVMFLGNLNIKNDDTLDIERIKDFFDHYRQDIDTRAIRSAAKRIPKDISEYDESYYKYTSQLNNTDSITHYKYGEKYRLGLSVMDKWGNWSEPIWLGDYWSLYFPRFEDSSTFLLPGFALDLTCELQTDNGAESFTIYDKLFTDFGIKAIRPLVVFPSLNDRKILAQGVVCPTVYNLKDRKDNSPYAQASWFMRPNAPVDILISPSVGDSYQTWIDTYTSLSDIPHNSDFIYPDSNYGYNVIDRNHIYRVEEDAIDWKDRKMSLIYDDISIYNLISQDNHTFTEQVAILDFPMPEMLGEERIEEIISLGSWVEFRHNYALRTKGWSWGPTNDWYPWSFGVDDSREWQHAMFPLGKEGEDITTWRGRANSFYRGTFDGDINGELPKDITGAITVDNDDEPGANVNLNRIFFYKFRFGGIRSAELDTSRFGVTIPVNRFCGADTTNKTWRGVEINKFNTGNSAYYVDNSIVTLNSPEIEMSEDFHNMSLEGYDFRIIGAIPLTATISDISLETTGSNYNPSASSETSYGFKKFTIKNKNIGHHGYKGLVTHSSFWSALDAPDIEYSFNDSGNNLEKTTGHIYPDQYVGAAPLYPWQSTGNIPGFNATWENKNSYSKLKRKILSNLRFSANTVFFRGYIYNFETENKNIAFMNNTSDQKVGWKPYNGSSISLYTSNDPSIVKLKIGKDYQEIVYSANIDSIALATTGDNNDIPIPIYDYFMGRKIWPSDNTDNNPHNPYAGGSSYDDIYRTSIGSSIKYKSSPHAVIGFNMVPHPSRNKYIQEILPYYVTNKIGKSWNVLEHNFGEAEEGFLYESDRISSLPHQSQLIFNSNTDDDYREYFLPGYHLFDNGMSRSFTYGWLWLGEIYKLADPTFGGTDEYALQNNNWEIAGEVYNSVPKKTLNKKFELDESISYSVYDAEGSEIKDKEGAWKLTYDEGLELSLYGSQYIEIPSTNTNILQKAYDLVYSGNFSDGDSVEFDEWASIYSPRGSNDVKATITIILEGPDLWFEIRFSEDISIEDTEEEDSTLAFRSLSFYWLEPTNLNTLQTYSQNSSSVLWTQGDTYYQRFDTLKTYAYSDSDENSIVDITSFMVETHLNIDGRTDRNRGQESNLQVSPENFNLRNDIYTQRDNIFTYRILDNDVSKRSFFPNQITWSLSKTAGESIDSWMNITLSSILDLDGTKGHLTALKTFNNNIVAFQDSGISQILFNSRVQIPTSENVPIQISNSGKVEGQQYFTTDLGCQDKWNIVTTPQGLYFVDYYNKSIYKFNGQIEDLSTANGFRGWCEKNIAYSDDYHIRGYYDKKNKEVMFYGNNFSYVNDLPTKWLGFSELTNTFSSFYTYPNARLVSLQDEGIWLYNGGVYRHQGGYYNDLLGTNNPYGLTVITKQDSNIVKTFNILEYRSDMYDSEGNIQNFKTFDTIQIEDEHNGKTKTFLDYSQFRPSNLKKLLRTWKAQIPRVGNAYYRYTNQWAKVGLWMTNPDTEKIILHDMAVWYTE